jgi:hypothetical protein
MMEIDKARSPFLACLTASRPGWPSGRFDVENLSEILALDALFVVELDFHC